MTSLMCHKLKTTRVHSSSSVLLALSCSQFNISQTIASLMHAEKKRAAEDVKTFLFIHL